MPPEPGLYRHYKNKNYRVLGFARHSETEEGMVIYHSVDRPEELWVRPVGMWGEHVDVGGRKVLRFERIGD